MTLEDFGNIGEIVGAIATLGTLLYLAVQVRANTRVMRAEARRSDIIAEAGVYGSIVENADVAELFQRGLADPKSLDTQERIRFAFLLAPFLAVAQLEFLDYKDGLRDSALFERNLSSRLRFLRAPGGREYWDQQRESYDPGFEARVDEWLADKSSAT